MMAGGPGYAMQLQTPSSGAVGGGGGGGAVARTAAMPAPMAGGAVSQNMAATGAESTLGFRTGETELGIPKRQPGPPACAVAAH
jgi:hypothetical protein